MDVSVISTYRCNSKCTMCHIWQNPTLPAEEITLETLKKIPYGIDNLNFSGGEPTLRNDLTDAVDILYPKARTLEISTNGLHPSKLFEIIKKYPDIKIRISIDGIGEENDLIRGEKNGFKKKIYAIDKLISLGGKDIGFAFTIQDHNYSHLSKINKIAKDKNLELATSILHNGFQFHKNDNVISMQKSIANELIEYITDLLKSKDIKKWFRAYLNLGLLEKAVGNPRLIPCTAGKDFYFLDPWANVFACNVRPDLHIGNLHDSDFHQIINSEKAKEIQKKVVKCPQNCWMVASARTAMRMRIFPQLPKLRPLIWVINNKVKVILRIPINLDKYLPVKLNDRFLKKPRSFLNLKHHRKIQNKNNPYYHNKSFYNG